jgi:glutathione S-transferase
LTVTEPLAPPALDKTAPSTATLMLFHHPFCPHSRFVRLTSGEMGLSLRLIEERTWERREGFLALNPAGTTPVLIEEGRPAVPDACVIAEYLDETRGAAMGDHRLLPPDASQRVEVRRLSGWFHRKCFDEVTSILVTEKIYKRYMTPEQGGGPPDTQTIRVARSNIRYHLAYVGWLSRSRNWLAGDRLSYADLAAAAHLSCADYLGDVPWNEDESAKSWYARVKSRPSFRPILADRLPGTPPSPTYTDLDF